jgi:hypothetical protein
MPRPLSLLFVATALLALAFAPVPVPKAGKASDEAAAISKALARMTNTWIQTSVRYSGEDLFDPPTTGHVMKFDGKRFTEFTPSGRELLTGEVKVGGVAAGVIRLDLPRKVIVAGRVQTVIVAAIARVQGKGRMQIAFFDPGSAAPDGKRPDAFESTPANRVVLITLRPKP